MSRKYFSFIILRGFVYKTGTLKHLGKKWDIEAASITKPDVFEQDPTPFHFNGYQLVIKLFFPSLLATD